MYRITITLLALLLGGVALAAETPTPPADAAAPAAPPAPGETAPVVATPTPPAPAAGRAAFAAEAYEKALESAEANQREALKAVESARRQLEEAALAAEQAKRAEASAAETELLQRAERERQRAIEQQLQQAHESLRRASREIARVHRDLNRPTPPPPPTAPGGYAVQVVTGRPVIGVVLGGSEDAGVPVLGVSPDGPADRAGIEPGDVIVAVMGKRLAGDGEDARAVLGRALEDIQAGDELAIDVVRGGEQLPFTVTVASREPYTWHGLSRLALAPEADRQLLIERIEVPAVDHGQLDAELEKLRERMETMEFAPQAHAYSFTDEDGVHEFGFNFEEDLSELGDTVIAGTNIWFGMPLTRGIKMTGLDAELGEYFDASTGVLVLKAEADNGLQLRTGDVILKVGGSAVATPGDVMRALREVDSGAEVDIDIKRDKRSRTLKVTVPENRVGMFFRSQD